MRRMTAGFTAFTAITGTLMILPVYASPLPKAHPVETSIDEIALGSIVEPEGDAVVTTDGAALPGGVEEPQAPQSEAPQSEAPTEDGGAATSGTELEGVPALTVSQPDTDTFYSVGVTWEQDPSIADVVVQVRVKDDAGEWGEWTSLEADDIEQTASPKTPEDKARGGTAPYWTGEARGVEVIVQAAGGAVPDDVRLVLLDPGTSAADDLPTTPAVQDQAHAGAAMPAIMTRAQWGANESIRTWRPEYARTIKAATLHHTADANNYSADQVPGMMRSIYAYHTVTRGWGDIGYNVIVDKFGRIFEGRYGGLSSTVIGAHAGGFNSGTFGVSMLGNYDQTDTPQVVLESVAAVVAWKLSLYGVNPGGTTQLTSGGGGTSRYPAGQTVTLPTFFGHRDVGSTACPGKYAYSRMNQLRVMVIDRTAPPGGSPVGNLEAFRVDGDELSLSGWTFDPDYPPGGVAVGVDVDGVRRANLVASQPRPDVGAAYPAAGPDHGFSGTVQLAPGERQVCVYFVNAPPSGRDTWMTCRRVTAVPTATLGDLGRNPIGNVEAVRADGRALSFSGWTFDPSEPTEPVDVHVYVDGQGAGALRADQPRDDVAARHPGAGPAHGFSGMIPVSRPGSFRLCLYAINLGAGDTNPELRCTQITVPATAWDPQGNLEAATVSGGQVSVSGWGFDVDAPTSAATVHVFVDGAYSKALTASTARPDVGRVFPGSGDSHGFSGSVLVGGGRHWICAFVLNTGYGTKNTLVGCRIVELAAAASLPIGNPDTITTSSTGLTVAGWALDPDAPRQPIDLHVYIDGRGAGSGSTGQPRADVAAVYPEAGANRGFSIPVRVGAGRHQVCVYAINTGPGTTNPLLRCQSVTV